jgi:hypothetical protein
MCIDVLTTKCVVPTVNPFEWNPALVLPMSLVKDAAMKDSGYGDCAVRFLMWQK